MLEADSMTGDPVATAIDAVAVVSPLQAVGKIVSKAGREIVEKAPEVVEKVEEIVKKFSEALEEGKIYMRTDLKTGGQYVGQVKSEARYVARQTEHARANKDAEYVFEELGRAKPGNDLDVLEENNK